MAITFPTTLDSFTNPVGTDQVGVAVGGRTHAQFHTDELDAIEALEAKVGANGSAVTTSHDYKLSEVTGSDKAVGKTATQTLTNKSLQDSTVTIVDDADATKAFKFEASGITTGTTRTLTVPDANTTIVGTDTVQTVTNKRIPVVYDSNGNEMIEMTTTASAVNNLEVVNATTGGDVVLNAKGDDTNVGLKIKGKGSGKVKLGSAELQVPNTDGTNGQVLSTNGAGVMSFIDAGVAAVGFNATALEDLTAGQTVGIALAAGDAKVVRAARNKTTLTNNPGPTAYIEATEYVAANKFVAVGANSGTNVTEGTVFTVDRDTMSTTSGALFSFFVQEPGQDRNNIVRLVDNRLLGAWKGASPSTTVGLYDISGTTISQTTIATNLISGSGSYFGQSMCSIDDNVVAIAKGNGTGSDQCHIVTVATNTITLTTTTNLPFSVGTGGLLTSPMCKISAGKFVITDGATNAYIGSYSGGTLTFGSALVTAGSIRNIVSIATDTFYAADASGNVGYYTVSGTTITAVDQASNITDTDLTAITTDGTNIYRMKPGTGGDTGKLTKVTLSGSTLSEVYLAYSDMLMTGQILGTDVANGYFVGYYNTDVYISGMTPHYVGIVQSTVSAGDTVSVKVGGVDGNQTGLTAGVFYKPSLGGLTPANIDQDSNQTLDILKAISPTTVVVN